MTGTPSRRNDPRTGASQPSIAAAAAAVAAAVAGFAAVGCGGGSTSANPPPGLYERCSGACAVGTCEYTGWALPDGYACVIGCSADGDCPPPNDGSAAICIDSRCRPAACSGNQGPTNPPVACVGGTLQRCDQLPQPPCSVCPVCSTTEYCDLGTETCRAKKQSGQPCTTSSECPTGDCRTFVQTDGTMLFDGKRFCRFPTGQACWPGDPCFCDRGACSFGCDVDADCVDQTTCVYLSFSSGTCRQTCGQNPTICGPDGICTDIGTLTSGPIVVCAAPSGAARPPRADGVPCRAGAECTSGTCCPAATGESWGHCAGGEGC